jgi:hypothetical protein
MRMILIGMFLIFPGYVIAGPPPTASGRMVLTDEVADGLRKYSGEKGEAKRVRWLERLARTKDPRVAVVLGEALRSQDDSERETAYRLLELNFVLGFHFQNGGNGLVRVWWKENSSDLRRRAKLLPK